MQNRRESLDYAGQCRRFVSFRDALPPHRPQSRIVIRVTRDHVHMKLRNGIAQSPYIYFAALRCRLHKLGRMGNFTPQLRLLFRGEIKDLGQAISLRHQDEPGIAAIVHQQDRTQWPVANPDSVGGKARIKRECHWGHKWIVCARRAEMQLATANSPHFVFLRVA